MSEERHEVLLDEDVMADDENKEQAIASAEGEQDVPVGEEFDDALSMVELVPQPEVDALGDVPEAEPTPQFEAGDEQGEDVAEHAVAPAATAENEEQGQKKQGTGIALPAFVERGSTDVFGGAGTRTGIPLPPRDAKHDEDNNAEHPRSQQHTVVSEEDNSSAEEEVAVQEVAAEEVAAQEVAAEQSEIRSEFSDTNSGRTQAGMQFTETGIDEGEEDILSARQLGAAITANDLFAFEPLATLADYPHLYQALLAVKGVWQSSVSMDDLIVANARVGQSDQRMEEVKNWYAMRIKKTNGQCARLLLDRLCL